ncbi:MAG: hypothetical protein H0X39_13645 [Actinobacteria bacterium]|nr:hypothetical protein [Actinomycetota bacterium]
MTRAPRIRAPKPGRKHGRKHGCISVTAAFYERLKEAANDQLQTTSTYTDALINQLLDETEHS